MPGKFSRFWSRTARLAAMALLLGAAVPAQSQNAGTQSYAVEIIIFRSSAVSGVAEDWGAAPIPRGFGSDGGRAGSAAQGVKILGADQYKLGKVESQLRSSGAWRPLAHVAWTQSAPNWGTHVGVPLADLGVNVPALSGTVYFERGQYPHLGFDLSWGAGPIYRIDEMRSVRYGDRQYFDHPAFGVIAVVTPVRGAPAP